MLNLDVAELAKSLDVAELGKSLVALDESTGIYLLKSPKANAASTTQQPQLLGCIEH